MKPSAFRYIVPDDLEEALEVLAGAGDPKVLAGGQSLVPAMNLRLAAPETLVDINRIPGHDRISVSDDVVTIGMLVRHTALEDPGFADPLAGALATISHYVGHLPIRTRGTFVGSLAHADPAAEWCALAVATEATIVARSATGQRLIPASEFFVGPFTTALRPDELATEVRIPLLKDGSFGFTEIARTAGDFATVAVVAVAWIEDGAIARARVALAGVEGTMVRARAAEDFLAGRPATPEAIEEAAGIATEGLDPIGDASCSADYRRHLARVLTARALQQAVAEAS